MKPQVVIVDDHHLFVQGLRELLARNHDIVGVAHSGEELLPLLTDLADDTIILLDLSMPGINGLELIADILQARPTMRILILSQHIDRVLTDAVLNAGARGFVPKDDGIEEVENAIAALAADGRYVSARIPINTNRVGLGAEHAALASLTPRQLEILALVSDGLTTAEIAAKLSLSQSTVTFHRINIRRVLGIDSESGLVRFAALTMGSRPK